MEKATLSVKETAQLLGINENSAYGYLEQGLIPARKLGKRWIISQQAVSNWLVTSPMLPITKR